jgi:IclR family transcriptional regulator, KDG regulon repressor
MPEMSESLQKADNVAAVLKVFAVLESMIDVRQATLAELASRAMTSKATAHRLLNTMIDLGYVEKNEETERYGLTLKLFSLGARSVQDRSELLVAADRQMSKLSRQTGEAINLGVLDNTEEKVVYLHKYDSHYDLSMQSTLGKRKPLHATSLGKALLAWQPEAEISARIKRMNFETLGPRTITDKAVLLAELATARSLGYAEEIEESTAGVRCMAVPVFDHLGRCVAAMSIAFPLIRFQEERKPEIIALIKTLGAEISASLGYMP